MNDSEKRTLDMFRRVRDFFAVHEALFPLGTLGRDLFNVIVGIVNDLEGQTVAESGGRSSARQGTVSKAVAKAAILEDLGILRRTARAMAFATPGLEEKFRIPHNPDDEDVRTITRAALAAAEPFKAEFLRREVQERVFQDMEANLAAFDAATTEQNMRKEESHTAAASIDATIDLGMDTLRQLDPIVRNKLHNNTATLAAWLSARHIERAPRRNNSNTPPAPQTPNS
jgi:hypothetical protein